MMDGYKAAVTKTVWGGAVCVLLAGPAFGDRGASLSSTRKVTFPAEGGELVLTINDRSATFAVSAPARSAGEASSSAIYPSFVAARGTFLPSVEFCRGRGAAFEEGARAAIELEKEGSILTLGRTGFLMALAAKLKEAYEADSQPSSRVPFGDALAFVGTALALSRPDGKVPAEAALPKEVASKASQDKKRFLKEDDLVGTPPGCFAWSEDIKRVYTASRWLGRGFECADEKQFKAALALAWAVGSDAELASSYRTLFGLSEAFGGMPPRSASPADYNGLLGGREAATVLQELGTVRKLRAEAAEKGGVFIFLPPPVYTEVELIRRFAADAKKGEGTWAEAYAASVREGTGSAAPARGAPWFDYFSYAWDVLQTPEGAPEAGKISWDEGYRTRLGESYVTVFDQVRARAAPPGGGTAEAAPVDVTPDFRLEPLPEYYLRMARAYARGEAVLKELLSASAAAEVRGRREGGAAAAPLVSEAADLKELFFGLYLLSCADVGITPAVAYGEVPDRGAAASRAAEWIAGWRNDADMKRDLRDARLVGPTDPSAPGKGKIYRCVLGVRAVDIEIKYDRKPSFTANRSADLRFAPAKYTVLVPVIVEVAVPGDKPLTRSELRRLCEEHKTEGAIVAALKEYGKREEVAPEEPEPESKREVDSGAVVLIVVLGGFVLIIVIALVASRQKY